jgi:phosphate-selective porin OprO/OprP
MVVVAATRGQSPVGAPTGIVARFGPPASLGDGNSPGVKFTQQGLPVDGPQPPAKATPQSSAGASSATENGAGTDASAAPAVDCAPAADQGILGQFSYRSNAGGGYTHFETTDGTFTVNLQNQITIDGTFYDIAHPPTTERNFNVPFLRTFLYGNVLKDWEYQISTQFEFDTFNILDCYVGYKVNDQINFRFGHFLSPFLYEYYAFSPAWEPVITNSPLFLLAGKRQTGAMLWGKGQENLFQYQVGVFNGPDGAYFDLDHNLDGIGSVTITPFQNRSNDSLVKNLGFGVSTQVGRQEYNLAAGVPGAGTSNGEPTTQSSFVGSTGIPFLTYNNNVSANGMRTNVAPHFFWYSQASILAEYVVWNRTLSDPTHPQVNETIHGFEVTGSYFLTGERHSGDGLTGFHVITPNSPFVPSKHQFGCGAWELVAQYSQMSVGSNVVDLGLVNPAVAATRLTQTMLGVNWWPSQYVRVSLDWMYDRTNRPVDLGNGVMKSEYNVFWTRVAMFF